jgi:hypothetical protein
MVYSQKPTPGNEVLRPGNSPTFRGVRGDKLSDKLNFLSLMLALFCGTASLPHILIRYYTVKDESAVRKSTVVGIAAIVGRHDQCDLYLERHASLALRHLAIVLDPVRTFFKVTGSLLQLAWQATSEAFISTAVLIRVIVRAILPAQSGLALLMLAAFLLSVSVLPFLLVKYHRAQTIE